MGHSVGKAADNAVQRSKKESKEELSPEQIIARLRNGLVSRLAVLPDDVRTLLAEYDKLNAMAKAIAKEEEDSRKAILASLNQVKELSKNETLVGALAEEGLQIDPELLNEMPGA